MKSVLQALWLMTTFFGNVIDILISGTHVIKEPAMEFFFYSFLMLLVIGIFVVIAMQYKYVEEGQMEDSECLQEDGTKDQKVNVPLPHRSDSQKK